MNRKDTNALAIISSITTHATRKSTAAVHVAVVVLGLVYTVCHYCKDDKFDIEIPKRAEFELIEAPSLSI